MASHFITGLDTGTSSIKVAVAEIEEGRPSLRAVFKEPSSGFRRGAIVDLAEASQCISRALSNVKKLSKAAAKNIYVNIGTYQVKAKSSQGVVPVSRSDTEIYQDDIERALKASQAVTVGPNRTVIHNVTREFIVDGVGDIMDPLGLAGSRLEVHSLIIDAFSPHIKSLTRAVELGGGEISGLVFGPLVASRSSLSKNQKDLGTALIDIGFGTTGLCVYEENKLIGLAKFPIGAGNISNDLAIGLRVSVAIAENLKLNYGYALAKEVSHKESIELKKFSPEAKGTVSRRFISEIIESRLAEIFELVNNELKLLGKSGQLPGGVVIVGGGAKLPGLTEIARAELKLSSQIGSALGDEWQTKGDNFAEILEDPEYATALGLILWGRDEEKRGGKNYLSGFKIRNLIKYFVP